MSVKSIEKEYNEKLKLFLEGQGYYNVRILSDGIVANYDFFVTTAVMIDPDFTTPGTRYCYENRQTAHEMCLNMQSVDDKPYPGITAIKNSRIALNGDRLKAYLASTV